LSHAKRPLLPSANLPRDVFGGFAAASAVFFVSHRLEAAGIAAPGAVGVTLVGALLGWSQGRRICGRSAGHGALVREAGLAFTVAFWVLWAMLSPRFGWLLTALLTTLGFALLRAFLMGNRTTRTAGPALGLLAGFIAFSAGFGSWAGMAWATVVPICAAAAANAFGRASEPPESRPAPLASEHEGLASGVFLCAALGALAVALARTYTYSAGSAAFALSDLGIAFCAGVLTCRLIPVPNDTRNVLLVFISAQAVILASLVLESSFFLYPDLILSESAARQTPWAMLTPGRIFPLWLTAFGLGVLSPLVSHCVPEGNRRSMTWAAAAMGGGAAMLAWASRWHQAAYALPILLCALSLLPVWLQGRARRQLGSAAVTLAGGAMALGGLVWVLACDADMGWLPLKSSYIRYRLSDDRRMNCDPAPGEGTVPGLGRLSVQGAHPAPQGQEATVVAPDGRGHFIGGNLVSSSRGGDAAPIRLAAALGLALCERPRKVSVVALPLDETVQALRTLAPEISFQMVQASGERGANAADLILCGPGALNSSRNSNRILSVETLKELEGALAPQGVFVLWLPTRSESLTELRRALATVACVFERFYVFASLDELVLLCGKTIRLRYAALRSLFQDGAKERYLSQADFWHPRQVLLDFVASSEMLSPLIGGCEPYRLSHPCRPPLFARDLAARSRPETLAAILQYRLAGPGALLASVEFSSVRERRLALQAFDRLYDEHTNYLFKAIGRAARGRASRFAQFLNGPFLNLSLFEEPGAKGEAMSRALACYRFGLFRSALVVLEGLQASGRNDFAVHYWMGRCLQELHKSEEALSAYKAALRSRVDSVDTLKRIVGLHLKAQQAKEAAQYVQRILSFEPENVDAMLMLSDIYGNMRRYDRATEFVWKALKIAPNNPIALQKLYLYSRTLEAPPVRRKAAQ